MAGTYYETLGVRPDAPQTDIYEAYTAALAEFRANPDASDVAKQRLTAVRAAFDGLTKTTNRRAYNAELGLPPPPERRWAPNPLPDVLAGHRSRWHNKYYWRARAVGLIAVLVALALVIVQYATE